MEKTTNAEPGRQLIAPGPKIFARFNSFASVSLLIVELLPFPAQTAVSLYTPMHKKWQLISSQCISDISKELLLNIIIFGLTFFAPVAGLVLNFCMWIFRAIMAKEYKKKEMPA